MSTRSSIGIINPDDSIDLVYCHCDGYVSHNGVILLQHYNTLDKVKELISLGGFSSLAKTIEKTAESAYTNRGETLSIEHYARIQDYPCAISETDREYVYFFQALTNTWFYAETGDDRIYSLASLTNLMQEIKNNHGSIHLMQLNNKRENLSYQLQGEMCRIREQVIKLVSHLELTENLVKKLAKTYDDKDIEVDNDNNEDNPFLERIMIFGRKLSDVIKEKEINDK